MQYSIERYSLIFILFSFWMLLSMLVFQDSSELTGWISCLFFVLGGVFWCSAGKKLS